jgi:hypothetical protein
VAHFLKLLQQYRKRMWADRIKFLIEEVKDEAYSNYRT